jgi:hypothetical protein
MGAWGTQSVSRAPAVCAVSFQQKAAASRLAHTHKETEKSNRKGEEVKKCVYTLDIWVRANIKRRGAGASEKTGFWAHTQSCNLLAEETGCQRQDHNQLQGSIQNIFYTLESL